MAKRPRIFATEDAVQLAKRRLPRMIFDFIEGSAGREAGAKRNETRFDDIMLQPRVLSNVGTRSLTTRFLGREYGLPFGIAPMGMCNLACPDADAHIARIAKGRQMPVCLSSAGSRSLRDMNSWSGGMAWFQLYFGQSVESSLLAADRARDAGYDTLILTVDVPEVSRRIRDQKNDFNLPFKMTPNAFLDFALHPRWSLSTLANGIPKPRNFADQHKGFDRKASRAGANWAFLETLRERWTGRLIVKGITSPKDAKRAQDLGVDAIYVSNHGGRQLDSAPPAINLLPIIRRAVGSDFPLLFDSGIRNGEDVIKALVLGADFVMLGRPVLFALAAAGRSGLDSLLQCFVEDIDLVMAQIGVSKIDEIGPQALFTDTAQTLHPKLIPSPEPQSAAT